MKKNVYEILSEMVNMPTRQDKINVLRFNRSYELDCVLRGTFHPGIHYLIDKIPPYKAEEIPKGMAYGSIHEQMNRIYLFERGNPKRPVDLTNKRMYELLTQMLESLEPKEAKILAGMLLKNLNIPGLDSALVREALPDLIP